MEPLAVAALEGRPATDTNLPPDQGLGERYDWGPDYEDEKLGGIAWSFEWTLPRVIAVVVAICLIAICGVGYLVYRAFLPLLR